MTLMYVADKIESVNVYYVRKGFLGWRCMWSLGAGVDDSMRGGCREDPELCLWASCRPLCPRASLGQLPVTWKCYSE